MSKLSETQIKEKVYALLDLGYTYREVSERSGLNLSKVLSYAKSRRLDATDGDEITKDAITIFDQGKVKLADKLVTLTHTAVEKAITLVENSNSLKDVKTAIQIADIVARMNGLVKKEEVTNIQINNISGFEFVPVEGLEQLKQIAGTNTSNYIDVDVEDKN